ncbi:uncharacterized protein LOC143412024 [Callospermophilus lateralis]|uniref:uncharacterized protein LOC143412024 n=1 Tax=Callospermophilus lateralis TaxID=76772 RepID=UPI004038B21D
MFSPHGDKTGYFQTASSLPSTSPPKKQEADPGRGQGRRGLGGVSRRAAPPGLRPPAPCPSARAGVPEEAAVFLGPRRGWVGTTGPGKEACGREWDAAPLPLRGIILELHRRSLNPGNFYLVAVPPTTTRHYPSPAGRGARPPGKSGPNVYFEKGAGRRGERPKPGGSPSRPLGPSCPARLPAGAGTRAGRRARPGGARPQARLIFMSGPRRPSSTAVRPDPGARHRPLCPSLLPPALPGSAHAGAAPPPPPDARRRLPAAPRQLRHWLRWREGGEPAATRALHSPASALPSRLKRKRKHAPEEAGRVDPAPRCRQPESAFRTAAPAEPSGRTSRRCPPLRSEAAAPGRPLPSTAATCPGRPRALGRRGRAWGGAAAAGLSPRLAGPGRGPASAPAIAK